MSRHFLGRRLSFDVSGQQSPSDVYVRGLAAMQRSLVGSVRCVGLRSSSLEAELRVPLLPGCA